MPTQTDDSTVGFINKLGRDHRAALAKATAPNTTTARGWTYEIRFTDTSTLVTNKAGIAAVKKAIDGGKAFVEVQHTAQGAASILNARAVISIENNDPLGVGARTTELCDRGVWLSDGSMISTDPAGVQAIASALKTGAAMADVQMPSGYVRTIVVAHVAHAVSSI